MIGGAEKKVFKVLYPRRYTFTVHIYLAYIYKRKKKKSVLTKFTYFRRVSSENPERTSAFYNFSYCLKMRFKNPILDGL